LAIFFAPSWIANSDFFSNYRSFYFALSMSANSKEIRQISYTLRQYFYIFGKNPFFWEYMG